MQEEELSREQLLLEVKCLRAQLLELKGEKADQEILRSTTTEHSDTRSAHLLGQAELAVRHCSLEDEQQFQAIAAATPVPILVSRLCDGLILYANTQLASLLDIPLAELIGHHTPDFYFNPSDRQKVLDTLAKDGYIQDYELHCLKADGSADGIVRLVRPHQAQGS